MRFRQCISKIQKQKYKSGILAAVFILLVVVALFVFITRPADGTSWKKYIRASSFGNDAELRINVRAKASPGDYLAFGGGNFITSKPMAEMEQIVQET